jgi:methionine-rich copper-binding protein CopC
MRVFMITALALTAVSAGAAQARAAPDPHAGHAGMRMGGQASTNVRTTPADGWMGAVAPTAFSVTFPHPMRLTALSLKSGDAAAVQVALPDAAPGTTISVPLPTLAKGDHVLTWSAQGADGHAMNGVVRFMVH